ncbi:MAG: HD domain-containing protein [Solirubrobacterales bacterium]|nr:HD domain-containing protein [Solirubrobacterales bacterium]OJU96289.1 MAG: hypothetical protein BGO23_01920 [Solirubrobacterales bacterium 67-14]
MAKRIHEVRDAVHGFVSYDDDERTVVDSAPFQRLRHIHQLALTYEVYPGASHKRFEHSLGVMHLTGRVFDTITRPDKISDSVRETIPEQSQSDFGYWRAVVRMAALCHDMGHLPFSHAAEKELLPEDTDHERLTWDIVHSDAMTEIFDRLSPPLRPDQVGKIAVGPRKAEKMGLGVSFNAWEAILAEIIVGDSFGADRMDYLLRDSLHSGVQYGHFDLERLLGTLRVMPEPAREEGEENGGSADPVLGCERGGLQSAEQLLLARYFMFSQVYHHPTRLAYNEHLKDFLKAWLPDGHFPTDVDEHLGRDDSDVLLAIKQAAADSALPGHEPARRIVFRDHFKSAYEKQAKKLASDANSSEFDGDTSANVQALVEAAKERYGPDMIAHGAPPSRKLPPEFPVWVREGSDYGSSWSTGLSDVLRRMPESPDEFVLADAGIRDDVADWLKKNREQILTESREKLVQEVESEVPQ